MDIGRTIAGLRDRSGLTQEQLADMIFVSKDLVSKWETGKSRPDYNSVLRMAGVFTVDPEEIVRTSDLIFSELSSCLPERFAGKVDEMTAAINSFLEQQSVRDRSVFVRRYYFMETPAEIGERYGISAAYARTVLMRTRNRLKKYFGR
ncbi:MAG: helix-turn-helix domain-containing protein [Clostridia bacterium]|nr:helix-turn-helix domain-containing protein [Clostridia bacterium]MCR5690146.1 helix-turn-helix domain-containing protein [Clostridiales bacterium]